MKTLQNLLFGGVFGLAVYALAGCTADNPNYCGDSCDPVLPSCGGELGCAGGRVCTSVGCAATCDGEPCAAGLHCLAGFCVPGGVEEVTQVPVDSSCETDEECASDTYCTEGGRCVPRCKSDEDCSEGEVCIECGKCQAPELPATCGAAPDFCQADADCGAHKACRAGRCHYECAPDSACPVGQVCEQGLCIDDPVPASPECALDLHCDAGTCINGYCHAYCDSQADCGDMMVCQIAVCQPDYQAAR